jgi:hypothetical protein
MHLWQKKLYKVSNIVFEVLAGARPFWPSSKFEPLIVGLTLHFASCPLWQLRQSRSILDLGRLLQSMWAAEEEAEWALLHQLSKLPGYLESL